MNVHSEQTVFVVDDDHAIRQATELLLQSVGLNSEIYESADEFLNKVTDDRPGCLLLDVRMPGTSGIDLQATLAQRGNTLPIIFVTGHGDVPMAVEAMRNGAIDFIQKPYRDQDLLDRIGIAFKIDSTKRTQIMQRSDIAARVEKLTKREREVFDLVVSGKPNKLIAHELGVSQRTVEIHRARVMEKMRARSLADLVRMHLSQ